MGKIKSLVGKKFGSLTVLELAGRVSSGSIAWKCLCTCGKEIIVRGSNLKYGNQKSCGCLNRAKELKEGAKYGKYTVLKHIGITEQNKRDLYLVKCECGKINILPKHNVTSNVYGCKECKVACSLGDRGKVGARLYDIWRQMLHRCYNSSDKNYNRYGGRGISVCNEWRNDVYSFKKWATNNGYKDEFTIERIDTNGNYEPSNCRWATRLEQANNTSRNRFFMYEGEIRTIRQIAKIRNMEYKTLYERIRRGNEKLKEVYPYAANS